jgi:alpha-galactosidase
MDLLRVSYINTDFQIDDFANEVWQSGEEANLQLYWSGAAAETSRNAKARLVWNEKALFVRFEANQNEPLVIHNKPNRAVKAIGLWERDVFEIFIAPDQTDLRTYFEFEAAPTGEWLDVRIEILPNGMRQSDFEYDSGMKVAAKIFGKKIFAVIKIEWQSFGKKPHCGEIWRGNLFRCIGSGSRRGYLAWQPTRTESPNFHVPEAFGKFEFVKN